jgi:hypothetical protein
MDATSQSVLDALAKAGNAWPLVAAVVLFIGSAFVHASTQKAHDGRIAALERITESLESRLSEAVLEVSNRLTRIEAMLSVLLPRLAGTLDNHQRQPRERIKNCQNDAI